MKKKQNKSGDELSEKIGQLKSGMQPIKQIEIKGMVYKVTGVAQDVLDDIYILKLKISELIDRVNILLDNRK